MTTDIKVGISDYQISQAPNKMLTLGLGSCIAIFIYDEALGVGGLSHIMLPDSGLFKGKADLKVAKFADLAIPAMVAEMKGNFVGVNLVAKVAGGASMFQLTDNAKGLNIGERNKIAVEHVLHELNIPLIASHTGGKMGRSVFVDLNTMDVTVKMVNRELITL